MIHAVHVSVLRVFLTRQHLLQGMRFGVSPEACRQALDLGFDWHLQRLSPAAQQAAQQVQQEAQAALQKVLLHALY